MLYIFFFPNRKLIITLGKKQKRKNESSDELSDAKQTPQKSLKDEDSQVSDQNFSLLNLSTDFLFPISPVSSISCDTVAVDVLFLSLISVSHR